MGSGGTCSDVVLLPVTPLGRDVPARPALPAHPEPLGQRLVWGHFTVLVRLWLISNWQRSAPLAVPVSPGQAPGISRRAGARGCLISTHSIATAPCRGCLASTEGGRGAGMPGHDVSGCDTVGALSGVGKEVLTGGGQSGPV